MRVTSKRRCEVIEAGVPLLAEKPLVFDLAQADELIEAAARRGLFFAINFNHRLRRAGAQGQGRLLTPASWVSLSLPPGGSAGSPGPACTRTPT